MRLFGVTGHPVLHSRSPEMFRRLFSSSGIDAAYTRIGARTADEALALARRAGVAGLNVTSPFKEDVYHLVENRDEQARRLGAVNTVVTGDGSTAAHNTDPDGVRHALRPVEISRGARVIVLGAGGAGRAAVHVLTAGGADVIVTSRTGRRSAEVAAAFGCGWAPLESLPRLLAGAAGVVSCLPEGVDIVDERWLHSRPWVLDAAYRRSVLAGKARRRGSVVLDGVDWLIGQAAEAFRVFVGRNAGSGDPARASRCPAAPEVARLMAGLPEDSAQGKGVALAGMMGAGKTVAGRELASRLGCELVDTDGLIAERTGRDIAWLFTHCSEEEFRRIEAGTIARVLDGGAPVIALGGGSLENAATRAAVRRSHHVVWLWASPSCLAARTTLDGTARPLLDGTERLARLERLLSARTRTYASSADLLVDAGQPLCGVVDLIEFELRALAS